MRTDGPRYIKRYSVGTRHLQVTVYGGRIVGGILQSRVVEFDGCVFQVSTGIGQLPPSARTDCVYGLHLPHRSCPQQGLSRTAMSFFFFFQCMRRRTEKQRQTR
jgi:hypothetical protein